MFCTLLWFYREMVLHCAASSVFVNSVCPVSPRYLSSLLGSLGDQHHCRMLPAQIFTTMLRLQQLPKTLRPPQYSIKDEGALDRTFLHYQGSVTSCIWIGFCLKMENESHLPRIKTQILHQLARVLMWDRVIGS